MVVADGVVEEERDIDGFVQVFHNKYIKINDTFEIVESILVIFNNIITTSKYVQFFKTNIFIIVTRVIDEEEQKNYSILFNIHNCIQTNYRELNHFIYKFNVYIYIYVLYISFVCNL